MDLHMKLGDNGEAFFVEENENTGVSRLILNVISSFFIYFFVFSEQLLIQRAFHLKLFNLLSSQSKLPAHLCTSPIPLEIPEDTEESPEGASLAVSGTRRKKRRRKRNRSDNHPRDAAGSSSEERDTDWERENEAGLESPPTEQPVSHLQVRLETRAKLLSLSELHVFVFHHLFQQRFKCFFPLYVSKSVYFSLSEEPFQDFEENRETHPFSDGEQSPTER